MPIILFIFTTIFLTGCEDRAGKIAKDCVPVVERAWARSPDDEQLASVHKRLAKLIKVE